VSLPSQLTADAIAIGKLQNPNDSPVLLAIDDTAQDAPAGLSALVADTSEIGPITVSNGPAAVSAATFLADQSAPDRSSAGSQSPIRPLTSPRASTH
jgi:hypothetical protein